MPSMEHEGPLQLIENAPDLSPRLLHALGVAVPDYLQASISNIDFSQIVPVQYQADKVVLLGTGRKLPALGIINELQLGIDPRKKYTWLLYNAALRAQKECDVCLLVIALSEAVARWAREPIVGLQPGCIFTPLVVGPKEIPWVRTLAEAEREPELAVLSAIAHGNDAGGLEVASAAVEVAAHLDNERKKLYADMVFQSLTPENYLKLVNVMDMSKYEPQSAVCKEWFQDGKAKGKAEGKTEGKAEAIVQVLQLRGVVLGEETQQRILGCTDPALLDLWLKRAIVAQSADEVLRPAG